MGTVTAKQLKQKTGEIIQRVRSGEHFTLTYRGKPVAHIAPSQEEHGKAPDMRPLEEAWSDIEKALQATAPHFYRWQDATKWVRNREPS